MIRVLLRNLRLFGVGYVFWDLFYQIFRKIHRFKIKNPKKERKLSKIKVNDYEMFIDENGKGIHRDLRMHSIREPESTKLVKEILKEDDVVLEAGANIGYYTILESKKIGKRGIVYAVE